MHKVLLASASLLAFTLTGCDIYFGPSSNSDCGIFEPCDNTWPDQPPGAPGGECASDYDCNAGCFCQFPDSATNDQDANGTVSGTCVETGFCDSASDCPVDFTCQADRATCVPDSLEPPPPPIDCTSTGCPAGTACDAATGQCVPSNGCNIDSDCGPGFECDASGTCQPVACGADADCLGGCACDVDTGVCEETGFCMVDDDCMDYCDPATGECVPTVCDTERATCTFGQSGPTCGAPLTCAQPAPVCPTGQSAEVVDGCYTGACVNTSECTDLPLAICSRIQNPNQCINRPDCEPRYDGQDCTCGGQACDCANPPLDNSGQPLECTCSIWVYSCESI